MWRENIMSKLQNKLYALWREEEGLTTVEYAIAGGLIGLVVIVAFRALGLTVIQDINDALQTPAAGGGGGTP
jgi:pilus assembly protein Flp/PilA